LNNGITINSRKNEIVARDQYPNKARLKNDTD
jgi:hypothetical protein